MPPPDRLSRCLSHIISDVRGRRRWSIGGPTGCPRARLSAECRREGRPSVARIDGNFGGVHFAAAELLPRRSQLWNAC
eukprot:2787086-Alexandrium_andersonii.AAC.1